MSVPKMVVTRPCAVLTVVNSTREGLRYEKGERLLLAFELAAFLTGP